MKKLFWVNTKEAELVDPRLCKYLRVQKLLFEKDQDMKNEKDFNELLRTASACMYESVGLHHPIIKITPGYKIPRSSTIVGISKNINKKLYVKSPAKFCIRKMNADCSNTMGKIVDKELKQFAVSKLQWHSIDHVETKCIINHLFNKRNISLVTSGLLVTNYNDNSRDIKTFSVTPMDLFGYDHDKCKFVVVEIKCTGRTMDSLLKENDSAEIDKKSGFAKSPIGRHVAQLACTSLMFCNTYPTMQDFYPLLVIFELGRNKCHSFQLDRKYLSHDRFSGWLAGF
jgi:hypothetical protein